MFWGRSRRYMNNNKCLYFFILDSGMLAVKMYCINIYKRTLQSQVKLFYIIRCVKMIRKYDFRYLAPLTISLFFTS